MKINKKSLFLPFQIVLKRRYLKSWVITTFLALTAMAAGLIIPYLVKLTVDDGITKKNLTLFLLLCLGAGLVIIAKHILDTFVSLRRSAFTAKIRFDLNRHIFKNMYAMPQGWFAKKGAGEAIYAVDNDSAAVVNIVGGTLNGVLIESVSVVATLAIILSLNIKIGLIIILFMPLIYFLSRHRFKRLGEIYKDMAGNTEGILNFLEESFWRSYLIKIFNAASSAVRRYSRLLVKDTRLTMKRERQEAWSSAGPAVLPMVVTGVIYIVSGYQAITGHLTLGTIAAIGGYIYQFITSSSQLLFNWQELQPGLISAGRLAPLLTPDKVKGEVIGENVPIVSGDIKIRGLNFSYDGGRVIFNNLNLDIKAEEYTVITGPSGCGKTTFLNLIMRLYEIEKGEILIGGKNINSLSLLLLGKELIICPQEPMLWNATVAENIAYPEPHSSDDQIKIAAALSGADQFISHLEKGYETMIGENATRLSQGQKQRLSLARALIKQPKILLLDEAFSGLPEEEEVRIITSLRTQFPKMTIVSATHRLAGLKNYGGIIKLGEQ